MTTLARVARRLGGFVIVATMALAGATTSCQLALNAGNTDPACDLPPETLCGGGRICREGRCVVCTPKPEVCNGLDDDCNGIVDDGFDKDGDGYSTCSSDKSLFDCNDDPATGSAIHPGAQESCNGIDDNCNGKVDEEPNDCSAKGLECWSDKSRCVTRGDCRLHGCTKGGCNPDTGQCTSADCVDLGSCPDPTTRCDVKTRTCVKIAKLGDACDGTILCDTGQGQCTGSDVLGLAGTGSVCASACCSTDQCPAGFVCRASGNGSSMCVTADAAGLTIGGGGQGASCNSGADCRSGMCVSGYCSDTCCAGTTCGRSGSCTIRSGDHDFLCRSGSSSGGYGASCSSNSSCKSGLCYGSGSFYGWCTQHCCTSADCSTYNTNTGLADRCDTVDVGNGTIVALCEPINYNENVGSLLGGDTCSADADCRSGHCYANVCDDTCCRDSDCAGGAVCRPKKDATGYPMHCVRP
jgi:hypothetical protein